MPLAPVRLTSCPATAYQYAMPERYVVIMAGGKGERFWPQSRLKRPKQLLPIVGDSPLLTQTVDRLAGLVPPQNVFIITNEEQAAAVAEACPQVPAAQIVAEPEGRDTAAAVGLGALLVRRRAADASFAVLPADHVIHDSEGFRRVMRAAFEAAESQEALVTVGIEPSFPATGYGYIQRGEAVATFDGLPVHGVRRFVEKPDEATACGYVNSGDYFWNAGMFIWRAPVVCAALERHAPGLWQGLLAIDAALSAGTPLAEALRAHYPTLKKISVDYALMEKADNVMTIPSAFDWDDVGAWPALARHLEADAAGNFVRGDGVVQDGGGNIVISSGGHLVALLGVEDCIVVHTTDATLVCPRSRAQDIKQLVKRLGDDERYRGLV